MSQKIVDTCAECDNFFSTNFPIDPDKLAAFIGRAVDGDDFTAIFSLPPGFGLRRCSSGPAGRSNDHCSSLAERQVDTSR